MTQSAPFVYFSHDAIVACSVLSCYPSLRLAPGPSDRDGAQKPDILGERFLVGMNLEKEHARSRNSHRHHRDRHDMAHCAKGGSGGG
jgi:hypothetical protein